MLSYSFDLRLASQNYLIVNLTFTTTEDSPTIQLPAWRPGRYELGNFAKNVRSFKVFSGSDKVSFKKLTKDLWEIDAVVGQELKIEYHYYAIDLNAGSTFLSPEMLYVNPVNCCMYPTSMKDSELTLSIGTPANWPVLCSMTETDAGFCAKNFDELADSPIVATQCIDQKSYFVNDTEFVIAFIGECQPQWEKVLTDFEKFTKVQVAKFVEFPVNRYIFMIFSLEQRAYHGVEHLSSTVITLGPSYDLFEGYYDELLGISSHELYHSWNIKSIRPIEMEPYDFTKENYSRLGYLCEGVTTYQGDLMLYKSGVFSENDYLRELSAQFQKHFDNHGRFNMSVSDSSFDAWLDGYVSGTPARKVSIYTEGCLLSFAIDVIIRRSTDNKYGLDEVMKRLYFDFALNKIGVSESDYQCVIEQVSGTNFDSFFKDYVNGLVSYEGLMVSSLEYLGLELTHEPHEKYSFSKLGFKSITQERSNVVTSIFIGSPADLGGLRINDEIISINNTLINGNMEEWLAYFHDASKMFHVKRGGKLMELLLPEVQRTFYNTYEVVRIANPNSMQTRAFDNWSK